MSRLTPWPPTSFPGDSRSPTSSTRTSSSYTTTTGSYTTTTGTSASISSGTSSYISTICSCCRCAIRSHGRGADATTSSSSYTSYTSYTTSSGAGSGSTASTLCLGCRMAAEKMQDAWGGPSAGGINPLRRRAAPGGDRVFLSDQEKSGAEGASAKQPDFPIAHDAPGAATDGASDQVPSTIRVVGGPKARPRRGNLGAAYLSGLEWGEDDAFVFEDDATAGDGAANVSIQCGAPTPAVCDTAIQTTALAAARDCGVQHVVAEWTADAQTDAHAATTEGESQTDPGPRTVETVEANATIAAIVAAGLAALEAAESQLRATLADAESAARDAFAGRVRHALGVALLVASTSTEATAAATATSLIRAECARLAERAEAAETALRLAHMQKLWEEAARAAGAVAAEETTARGEAAVARAADAAGLEAASLRRRLADADAALAAAQQRAATQEQQLTVCAVREGELRVKLRHALYLQAASNSSAFAHGSARSPSVAPPVDPAMPVVVRFARAHALAARAVNLERDPLLGVKLEEPACAP